MDPKSDAGGARTILQLGASDAVAYCGRLLIAAGLRVVQITAPDDEPAPSPVRAAIEAYLGQDKDRVALDLEPDAGRRDFGELLGDAHCLIADRTLPELAALGVEIGPDAAAAKGLVVVAVSPWGSSGPQAMRKATDLHMFHGGGLGAITPRFANNPEQPPLRLGYPLSDYLLGLNAAVSAMAGLNHRRETGEGAVIDVSGQQAVAHAASLYFAAHSYEGRRSSRVSRPGLAPFHFLPCRDGHVMIICPEEHQWQSLVDLMGNPEWAGNELFATAASRALYWDAIEPQVHEWLADKTKDELYHLAQAKRIPLAQVNNVDSVLAWEHLEERGFFEDIDAGGKWLRAPGMPFQRRPMKEQ